jgi:hypothetical protein
MSIGLDLQEEGDGYALMVTDADGETLKVPLTDDQLLTLAQSAPLFQARVLAKRSRKAAGVSAVWSTPVEEALLNTDLLNEKILLTLVAPNKAQVVYELTPHLANNLVQRLPERILEILSQTIPGQSEPS